MPDDPQVITMRHLAEKLGVSVSTVSLSLNGSPKVAEATRKKVLRMADKLGYRPDPVLAALNRYRRVRQPAGQRDTLALLIPDPGPGDPPAHLAWFRSFQEGIAGGAAGLGYHLISEPLRLRKKETQQLARQLYHRGVRGLILAPSFKELTDVVFDWSSFCVVATSLTLQQLGFHTICTSSRQATEMAMNHIAAAKHRPPVGFVHTLRGVNRGEDRCLGSFLARQHLRPDLFGRLPPCLLPHDPAEAMSALGDWFDTHKPGVLLFGGSSVPVRFVEDRRLKIPRDLAMVALEAEKFPNLSGAVQPLHASGIEAVQQLHHQLTHGTPGKPANRKFIMIDCEWRDAGSI